MPELPEVETVCRVIRRGLQGKPITEVEVVPDPIVFGRFLPRTIEGALLGRVVREVGRHGKYFWLALEGDGPAVVAHLGMSGWVREVGGQGTRLHGHGEAPFDDESGRPRFLRLLVRTRDGTGIAFTDPRRLGRIWLAPSPESDPRLQRLGPDAYDHLPRTKELAALWSRREIPIKAVLLDQRALAGIGNWIADEVLYQSGISPKRIASSLTRDEIAALRLSIRSVLEHAVKVESDFHRFPKGWLFTHRWGGARGSKRIGRYAIVREDVGGRTTAWVPERQK